MDRLDAQFTILKQLSPTKEIDQTTVNEVVHLLEEEADRQKIYEWMDENNIRIRAFKTVEAIGMEKEKTTALIRNRDNDMNLAVFGHDPGSGRVVGRINDSILQKLFNKYVDESIIIYLTEQINGSQVTRRRKVVPNDPDYLKHLLSKFIIVPYDVRWMKRCSQMERLDSLVDNIFNEEVGTDGL